MRLWRARHRWQPSAAVRTYLFTIAGRLCLNRQRGWRRQPPGLPLTDDEGVPQPISDAAPDPERVAGFVNPGSEVAVFVTVTDSSYTRIILNRATVIGVGQTSTTSRTTTDEEGTQTIEEVPKTILTLALTQKESEKLIWADRFGDLNFALLSDKTKVVDQKGVDAPLVLPGLPAAAVS